MNNLWGAKFTYAAFLIFLGYFLLLSAYYLFLGIVGFIESKKWVKKREEEDYSLTYFTTFDIPVSIVLPAHNEELWIADSVKSILNLNYPKFELVIVDDGSTDGTFKELNKFLDLRSTETVYARHYKDGKIFDILKSHVYPNVRVVRKGRGEKKAGAVNAGLNIAKHDYVCVMDADTVLEQDSLLKVMTEVNKDPQRIVGIGSYFSLSNGFKVKDGVIIEKKFPYQPVIAYQHLEYIRSFLGSRVGWSRFKATPIIAGGFGVWRRDVLYELGGYSSEFTCEDLEFTFRAHKYIADNKKPYRILMLPYFVAWTYGPQNIPSLIQQRDRWQRVEIETVWKYRSMCFNPKYGSLGFIALPYYLFYEVLGVFFEIASLLFVLTGCLLKILDIRTFLAFLALMVLVQAVFSLVSLFSFIRIQRIFSKSYVIYLIFLALTEFVFYRWIISLAKLSGTFKYFRGIRVFDQFARAKRS
ncbi:MAG: glycosyltransferase [Candidatus Omnitrophica bacterium]|nr:glycosyltransferase [Candidatus Omnitrophota bacterium]